MELTSKKLDEEKELEISRRQQILLDDRIQEPSKYPPISQTLSLIASSIQTKR